MDSLTEAKIQSLINEIDNQLKKDHIDDLVARVLFGLALSKIKTLTTHIGYLESKLDSAIDSNNKISTYADNLIAENQRLNSIAKY